MIGISVAAKKEWEATLNYFGVSHEECIKYPFGEYFKRVIENQEVILYLGGVKKDECICIYAIYDRSF